MAAATSLVFNIIGNNQASQALSAVGSSVDGLGDKVKKWGLAAAAGVAAVGVAAVSFGVSAVNAASDLNETMSKSSAIFGDQADDIAKWGDTAAKTMGLSKSAALAAAAGFGDMFTQLGFGGDVAADMSKDVVQMSADLGSFNNLGTDDVADRISAAFRGEYDSLQALIPNINAARVETEAMAASGKTNASELTAQEKAAAVLAIVHKDGARAAGDFAKTSNGLANQQKILSASFEDVKAKVGTALLPVLTKLGTFAIDKLLPGLQSLSNMVVGVLGPAFNGLTSGFRENDVTSTGLFGTFEMLGVKVREIATWVQTVLVPAMISLWSWVQEHIIPAVTTLATSVFQGLSSAFDMIKGKIEENKPQLEQLWGWFVTLAGFITDYVVPAYATYLKGALEVVGTAIGVLIDIVSGMVASIDWAAKAAVSSVEWIGQSFNSTKDWIGRIVGDVVGFFAGLPASISGAVSGAWDGLTGGFKAAINMIIGWWNRLSFPTFSIPKISIPMLGDIGGGSFGGWNLPDIAYLAKGGIVTGPTLAMIGEGAHDEAVIPLPKGKSDLLNGGGKERVVVVPGDALMQMFVSELRRYVRINGGGDVQIVLGS